MFEESQAVRHLVTPPQKVLVHLERVLPARLGWGRATALWVRAQGVPCEPRPALLHEWVLTNTGSWAGRCTFRVPAGGDELALDQLVPDSAIDSLR